MRKILILSLILFIISIGAVSAADDTNTTDLISNDGYMELGDEIELQTLINNAEYGGSINLNKSYVLENEVYINKEITIYGNGMYLQSSGSSNIFVATSNIFLYDITFIGGSVDGEGGAIRSNSYVGVHNCEFINNNATGDGGAIFSSDGVNVWDSIFYLNTADLGGAIASNNVYCSNVTFYENYADMGGAIFGINCGIENSQFMNNTAHSFAGSVFASKYLSIKNSLLVDYNIMELVDYYNEQSSEDSGLYLVNNTMYCLNPWDIWFDSPCQILTPVYLLFADYDDPQSGEIEIAALLDDNGNVIRINSILLEIYDGDTLIDEEVLSYDNGFYYNCTLSDGVYKVTGSLVSEIATNVAVIDGKLTVGNSQQKLNSTIVTTVQKTQNNIVLTATITPTNATGTVTFDVNGKKYNATVINGKATKSLYDLEEGSYTVKTSYGGDNNYNAANAKDVSFKISSASINIDAPELTKYYGGSERFTVNVTDSDGNPIAEQLVKITINGKTYNRTTNSTGIASMAINLGSNAYDVEVECNNEKVNSKVTIISTIVGGDITKIFRNATQYYATCTDSKGNLLKNTAIEFNINGVFYTRYTNESGIVRMNINLNPNTYIITYRNTVTNEIGSNLITVLPSIIENHDLTKYFRNASQYVIKILDDQGNPAKAGVKVTFNINGVFYERFSNESGHVRMNINLNPGTYIITANYNGLLASNTIKVLDILYGNDITLEFRDGTKYEVKLVDGQGNPYPNQMVSLNINGVVYQRQTDENGIARLTINLIQNTYVITASFNGSFHSNKITVTPEGNKVYHGDGFTFEIPKSHSVSMRTISDENGNAYATIGPIGDPLDYAIEFYSNFKFGGKQIYSPQGWTNNNWFAFKINTNNKLMFVHEAPKSNQHIELEATEPYNNAIYIIINTFKLDPSSTEESNSNSGNDNGEYTEYDCGDFSITLPNSASIEVDEDDGEAVIFNITYIGDIYNVFEDYSGLYSSSDYLNQIISEGATASGTYNGWSVATYGSYYFLYKDYNGMVYGVFGPSNSVVKSFADSITFL